MQGRDPILTVADLQAAEQALFDAGLPPFDLMKRAGDAAAQWIWRIAAGRSITVLCGPGNNGGDGYVIAAWLHRMGSDVAVIAALDPVTNSAKEARAAYSGRILPAGTSRQAAIFVDCLFGSGQNRALSGDLFGLVQALRGHHGHHVAVDLPSGVASDTASLLNDISPYDTTLALGAWKWAHWSMPAAARMGQRVMIDIGLDLERASDFLVSRPALQSPAADTHKYSRGLVAVVAGAMPGAAALCARAAQHGGAGYVKVLSEARVPYLPDSIVVDDRPLREALEDTRIAAIVVGPGLGRDAAARERLAEVLALEGGIPTVLDADALHLAGPDKWAKAGRPVVLTPHEGELRALASAFECGASGEQVFPAKLATAKQIAHASGATVVAKGADTFVYREGSGAAAAPSASSWLSVAGTGDVLAGLIASRLATGADPHTAACEAVWLHSEAARLAGPAFSADGLVGRLQQAYAACL